MYGLTTVLRRNFPPPLVIQAEPQPRTGVAQGCVVWHSPEHEEKPMPELSRRTFLASGAGVAAAGVAVAAMPGLVTSASASPADRAAAAVTVEQLKAAGPIVVHVRDAASGEISVMSGEDEVVFRDPSFIARIVAAANGHTES